MVVNWGKENDRDVSTKIILFLISPFVALLYSIRELNKKSSFWIIFGFCVCFGIAFTVGIDRVENSGDGVTYRILFEQYRSVSTSAFMQDFAEYLQFDEGAKDFYADTVSFLVSRVTGNYHVLFMVYAIIFAFFQLQSLRFFISNNARKTTIYVFLLFVLFTSNQIFNINGVRFWTAAWIAVYSALQIFYNGNKRYLLLAAFTPLIHGGFFLFLMITVLALFTSKYRRILLVIYILSFAFSTIAVDVFNAAFDYLPGFMANQASAYLDEGTIASYENQEGTGFWFVAKFFGTMSKIYITILVLLLATNKNVLDDNNSRKLLGFLLILGSLANFTMPIPSVGKRFVAMLNPFIAVLFVKFMPENKYYKLIYCYPFLSIFSYHQLFLNYIDVVGYSFFLSSPIIIVIKNLFLV